jgi:glycosyltransferase involved in cell wall biosynthesis
VLYNGVDLEQFRPRPATGWLHRELGIPSQSRLVAAIGQIGLRKGQDVLARAAARLAPVQPGVHWLIVGQRNSEKTESHEFEAELRQSAAGPLAGRFHLLGRRDDVDRLLGEVTLVVHPARQEPLGRVLLESAAAGVAIIATDVGGTREIFPPDSGAARLIPPDNPDALAEAMSTLLNDPPLRQRMAAAARRRAEEAFSIDRAIAGLVGHYREVLAGAESRIG